MSAVITIANVRVRRDGQGRYSLNDLHKAAVRQEKATESHRPGTFMKRPETQALIAAIKKRCTPQCIAPVSTIRGGAPETQGTYVSKVLVIAYAMWIDADFHLDVIEAFDTAQTEKVGLWQRMLDLVARDKKSKETSSVASLVLLDRKRDLIGIRQEKDLLQNEMEADLFMPSVPKGKAA